MNDRRRYGHGCGVSRSSSQRGTDERRLPVVGLEQARLHRRAARSTATPNRRVPTTRTRTVRRSRDANGDAGQATSTDSPESTTPVEDSVPSAAVIRSSYAACVQSGDVGLRAPREARRGDTDAECLEAGVRR